MNFKLFQMEITSAYGKRFKYVIVFFFFFPRLILTFANGGLSKNIKFLNFYFACELLNHL